MEKLLLPLTKPQDLPRVRTLLLQDVISGTKLADNVRRAMQSLLCHPTFPTIFEKVLAVPILRKNVLLQQHLIDFQKGKSTTVCLYFVQFKNSARLLTPYSYSYGCGSWSRP